MNNQKHFVEQTVKQIGWPRWDKIISNNSNAAHKGNTETPEATYYIPFVRDSQGYVNASMIIRTYTSDTAFFYKCDWQYQEMRNSAVSVSDSAEQFAVFFMMLDNHVFGHKNFTIKDTGLFKHDSKKALSVRIDKDNTGGRNAVLTPVTFCVPVRITFEDCPWILNDMPCSGPGGSCDHCGLCMGTLSYTYCWEEYIDDGSGGSGGDSGSGGNGGTGSGGSGTPPNCTPGQHPPCEPGWIPEDEGTPPACDPYIGMLSNDTAFQNRFKYLKSKTNENKEYGYAVFDRANKNYQSGTGSNYDPSMRWDNVITPGTKIEGLLHSHYAGLNNIFSPNDILYMASLFLNGYVKDTNNFYMGIVSNTDAPYLIKITNPVKFRVFAQKIINKELKNKGFTQDYNLLLSNKDNMKNLKSFFQMLQDNLGLAGVAVYEAVPDQSSNYSFDQWKKLNWDGNFDFNPPTICQ